MWASMTDADSYLLGKLGGDLWESLPSDQKQRALVSSYRILSSDKNYNFPHVANNDMVNAQIELAFALVTNPEEQQAIAMRSAGVSSFTVGRFSVSYTLGGVAATYPAAVCMYIDAYRIGGGHGRIIRR